jgi:type I restriction enzyme S subunit
MIADLRPYADYKEAGLPWLGRLPTHWDVRLVRHLGRLLKGVGGTKEDAVDDGVPCVRYGELYTTHRGFIRTTRSCISPQRSAAYTPIYFGDVLFAASGEKMEEIGKSAVNLMAKPAVCGGDVIILRPNVEVHAPFLGYALDTHHAAHQKATMGRGTTIKHIYPDELRSLALFLPPPAEQAAIVRFLDWANGRLEQAIRAKRKVIALLNEQKQAIIHRAVSRGLDPTVLLKPSGIPWLGDIPAHWEVRKLKHLTRFVNGLPFKPGDWKSAGVPIIRIQNLNGSNAFNYTDRAGWPEELLIQPGDLMFAWSGNRGTSFGSFEWSRAFPGYLNQHIFKLVGYTQPRRYFYYLLRAVTRHVEERAGGIIGLVHVTKPELGSVTVPVAPAEEAAAIARDIDNRTTETEGTIARLKREIDLLREYRTRLVADVVTGKLDVREAAARLPDEETQLDTPDAGDTDPDEEADA